MIARPKVRLILSHCHIRSGKIGKRPSGVTDCPRSRPELHHLSRGKSAGYSCHDLFGQMRAVEKTNPQKAICSFFMEDFSWGWVHFGVNSVSGGTRILFLF